MSSLRLGGRLDRYVARGFATTCLVALGVSLVIAFILGLATNLAGSTVGSGDSYGNVVLHTALGLPPILVQIAPIASLVAGQIFTAVLIRHNEVSAARLAGIPAKRLMLPAVIVSLLLSVGILVLQDPVLRATETYRGDWSARLAGGSEGQVIRDVWFFEAGGAPVHAERFVSSESHVVFELEASVFEGNRWVQYTADRATFDGAEWVLEGGLRTDREGPVIQVDVLERLTDLQFLPADITMAHRGQHDPLSLSSREAHELARRSPSNTRWETLLEVHRAAPWSVVALNMLGVACMLGSIHRSLTRGILLGFLTAFGFVTSDMLCRSLGLQGSLSPIMAGWAPLLLFGSLGLVSYFGGRS